MDNHRCKTIGCELEGLCRVAEISFANSFEGCEALRAAIKDFGGVDKLYESIFNSLEKTLKEPEPTIEKISLQPFNAETLDEGLVYFYNKELWRENYDKPIIID